MAGLPTERPLHLGFVCTGNICRSPSADVVFAGLAQRAGLVGVTADSCGLGTWHLDERMDDRSARHLAAAGYNPEHHRAQGLTDSWFETHGVLFAMDRGHLAALHERAPASYDRSRLRLFGDFDPVHPGRDVPDPYFGGDEGFAEVLATIERTCAELVRQLGAPS